MKNDLSQRDHLILSDLRAGVKIREIRDKYNVGYTRIQYLQNRFHLKRINCNPAERSYKDEYADFYDWWCSEWDAARIRILMLLTR